MKFPVDSHKNDVIKTFMRLRFVIVREGNHIIMERKNSDGTITPLVMPNHKTINSGTLRAIVNQIGITRDDFLKAYYGQ
ncbi:MAG: type II toxin-antitoxin system HicA family toxin [Bacteroidetes bacterium]|nr:MAG: type II toxin-antitoxin system HicA family toxin [Bacteroidota bacterium]